MFAISVWFLASSFAVTVANAIFVVVPARLTVHESSPTGHVLWNVTAGNTANPNQPIEFSVQGGVGEHFLRFRPDSPRGASLMLKERLSFNQIRKFSFAIVASSKATKAQVEKIVTVEVIPDASGSGPFWQDLPYNCQLPENSTIGSQRSCSIMAWTAYNQSIHYNLHDVTNTFGVDRRGVLTLKKKLNYLERQVYRLMATATDAATNRNTTTPVILHVTDVPNQPPKFHSDQFYCSIPEDSEPGRLIYPIRAAELDVGAPSPIRYRLIQNEVSEFVAIDGITGDLVVRSRLSRNHPKLAAAGGVIGVRVEAFKPEPFRHLSSYASVQISLVSINLHRPTFTAAKYYLTVKENSPVGTTLSSTTNTSIIVRDNDPGLNGLMHLSLLKMDGSAVDDLSVSPTFGHGSVEAVLSILKPESFDYEQSRLKSLLLVAKEINPSSAVRHTSTATLIVAIENLNDNAPWFTQSTYHFTIPENYPTIESAPIGRVQARDRDAEEFSAVTYSVEPSHAALFRVSPIGEISVGSAAVFDYEKQPSFAFLVMATDRGNLTASARVVVSLTNVDDCPPWFDSANYSVDVSEITPPGRALFRVRAEDCDGTRVVKYALLGKPGSSRMFSIGETTGVITLTGVLNYESEREHLLEIEASEISTRGDGDADGERTVARLAVRVLDANAHRPEFVSPSSAEFRINEHSPAGSVVVSGIEATDGDSGDYGRIAYRLLSPSPLFSFENGSVITKMKVTLEYGEVHRLVIEAADNPSGFVNDQHRTLLQLTVFINDINNNAPTFRKPAYYVPLVDVTKPDKRIVTRVEAYDADSGENARITYAIDSPSLRPASALNFVSIDAETGDVGVDFSGADAENGGLRDLSTITLSVVATDHGSPALKSSVAVTLFAEKINWQHPKFVQPAEERSMTMMVEELGPNTDVYYFRAIDHDQGESGIVRYRLPIDCIDNRFFQIDQVRGNLTSIASLDYERQKVYQVCVEAYDLGVPRSLSTLTHLTVHLVDRNDNPPRFVTREVTYHVPENANDYTLQNLTMATDRDELAAHRLVCYYLVVHDGHLGIDRNTGLLSVARAYDYETKHESHAVVMATNYCNDLYGDPNVYAVVFGSNITLLDYENDQLLKVRVMVDDLNDNGPEFNQSVITKDIIGSFQQGDTLFDLRPFVIDADRVIKPFHFAKIDHLESAVGQTAGDKTLISISDDRYVTANFASDGEFEAVLPYEFEVVDHDGLRGARSRTTVLLRFVARSKQMVIRLSLSPSFNFPSRLGDSFQLSRFKRSALSQVPDAVSTQAKDVVTETVDYFVTCSANVTGTEVVIKDFSFPSIDTCTDYDRIDVVFYAINNASRTVAVDEWRLFDAFLQGSCNLTNFWSLQEYEQVKAGRFQGVKSGSIIAATSTLLGLFVTAFVAVIIVFILTLRKYRVKLQAATAYNYANKPCVVEGFTAGPNAHINDGFVQQSSQCTSMLCANPIWNSIDGANERNLEGTRKFCLVKSSNLATPDANNFLDQAAEATQSGFDNYAFDYHRGLPPTTFRRVARKLYIPPAPNLDNGTGTRSEKNGAESNLNENENENESAQDADAMQMHEEVAPEAEENPNLGVIFRKNLVGEPVAHERDQKEVYENEVTKADTAACYPPAPISDDMYLMPATYEHSATKV